MKNYIYICIMRYFCVQYVQYIYSNIIYTQTKCARLWQDNIRFITCAILNMHNHLSDSFSLKYVINIFFNYLVRMYLCILVLLPEMIKQGTGRCQTNQDSELSHPFTNKVSESMM